jgi:transcription-repair coupling factor (superfamily II helicase)
MSSFTEQLLGIPEGDGLLRRVLERLKKGRRAVLGGLVPGAKALVLLHLHRALARHMVLVAADEERAVELVRHLCALGDVLGSPPPVRSFPSLGASPYEGIEPHFQAMAERVGSLVALHDDEPSLVVATAAALLEPLPEPEEFARLPFQVDAEAAMEPRDLASRLQGIGYQRVDLVSQVGEFALRGGVLDVYPPLSDLPRRLEFLGGTVESVRRFDPETQRSLEPCGEVQLPPVREFPWDKERVEMLARRLEGRPGSSRRIGEMTEALRSRASLPGMEACAAMVAPARFDLMDHAPGALLAVDEPFVSRAGMETAFAALEAAYQSSEGIFPPPDELSNPMEPLLERLEAAPLAVAQLAVEEDPEQVITLHSAAVRNYRGRIRELSKDLGRSTEHGMRNLLLVRGAGRAQRLREILEDYGVTSRDAEAGGAPSDPEPGIYLGHAALEGGFELHDRHLVLLTEHEIFGETIRHRPPKKARLAAFASDFRDLKPGDLVVHVDHGIGRFEGLRRIGDGDQEMMCLVFRGDDRLFVRLDRLDLVQKYSGVHGAPAVLDRLGGTAWQKTRVQVRKAVRDMTAELLQLYARRKAMTGHAFPPDTEWQAEFEGAFEYTETPDQARAIEEIKADLQAPRVMDRLLVGDVGFGKTEVAMRAAFKVVSDRKQVAVLSPTTVLAFQHQRTFSSRFASFPVRVEMLSRFTSRADQKKVLVDAAAGQVDILIGTHRLLSKDVKLPNLGLLVIDEEQRFGVVHKEQIKKLSANVDVLSMSATPIPRTLQMSLAGVRDMSVIETPPENRLAIQTTLVPFREQVITAAIRQELKRHGQVYFVHNRVESIYSIAGMLQRLVPECRAAVAHGQMPE